MKQLIADWKGKKAQKMSKEERIESVYSNLSGITRFYLTKSHNPKFNDQYNELLDVMAQPKFIKAIKGILKGDYETNVSLAPILAALYERRHKSIDEESAQIIQDCISKILKKRIKEVTDATGINKDLATDLLIAIPEPEYVHKVEMIGIYVRAVTKRIYINCAEEVVDVIKETKSAKKLFNALFGKGTAVRIAMALLLERKDTIKNATNTQLEAWNLLTAYALDVIEKGSKKEIKAALKELYIEARKADHEKGRDVARRIVLTSVSDEDYPNIAAAVSDLAEKDKYKQFL